MVLWRRSLWELKNHVLMQSQQPITRPHPASTVLDNPVVVHYHRRVTFRISIIHHSQRCQNLVKKSTFHFLSQLQMNLLIIVSGIINIFFFYVISDCNFLFYQACIKRQESLRRQVRIDYVKKL